MNISTRLRAILDWLHDGQPIRTDQMAERFDVSAQTIRRDAQAERKRVIARAAASQRPGDATLFLGYGTTVAEFARALPPVRALRVVTNKLDAAIPLAEKPAVEPRLAGDRLRPRNRDTPAPMPRPTSPTPSSSSASTGTTACGSGWSCSLFQRQFMQSFMNAGLK